MQGIEWILEMYCSGQCTDYRYIYDAQAPTPHEMLQHLKPASGREASSKEEEEAPAKQVSSRAKQSQTA